MSASLCVPFSLLVIMETLQSAFASKISLHVEISHNSLNNRTSHSVIQSIPYYLMMTKHFIHNIKLYTILYFMRDQEIWCIFWLRPGHTGYDNSDNCTQWARSTEPSFFWCQWHNILAISRSDKQFSCSKSLHLLITHGPYKLVHLTIELMVSPKGVWRCYMTNKNI
jgi:hypothetical protein